MPYLICKECDTCYNFKSKEETKLEKCVCGGELEYSEKLENKSSEGQKEKTGCEELIRCHEAVIAKIILYSIANIKYDLSINKVIKLLRGAQDMFIIDQGLNELPTYSLLKGMETSYLQNIIYEMLQSGLLEEFTKRKALLITDKGMEFLSSPRYLNTILFNNQSRQISPEDKILFNGLRDLRKDISITRNVPAYIICGNDVLLNMAREKPLNKDSLLSIKGVGEKFLENYGEAFLDLIGEYNLGKGKMVGMDY